MIALDCKTPKPPGAEGQVGDFPCFGVDLDEKPAPAVERIDLAVDDPRRVRHRKVVRHDPVGFDIDQHTFRKRLAVPAVCFVRPGNRGDIFRLAVQHRQTVEVTTVLGDELRNEIGLPDRTEAVDRVQGGEARIGADHEHGAALAVDRDLVRVDIASDLTIARQKHPVELAVGKLTLRKDILQPPDLHT